MKVGWIIGIVMAFVLLSVVASICELAAPLSATAVSRLDVLMKMPNPATIGTWLQNLWSMLWFDYPFLTGTWTLARYIFFLPVSVGMSVMLAIEIARLLATVASGIGRLFFR